MAKQKKNGGRKRQTQGAFRLARQAQGAVSAETSAPETVAPVQVAQAQGAVDAGASDAFEPEQAAQVQSLPGQPEPVQETVATKAKDESATALSFSFAFKVPPKQRPPEWQPIMVRVLPEDWNTLQALAEEAGIPLAAFCRAILHSAAQQAREQGAE